MAEENYFKEIRGDKTRFVVMPWGKKTLIKYVINYKAPAGRVDDKYDGKKAGETIYICKALNGRDKHSFADVFTPEIYVIFGKHHHILGFRQLVRLLDLDGRYKEWKRFLNQYYYRVKFRGPKSFILASMGIGSYALIRVHSHPYPRSSRGSALWYLYGLEIITQYISTRIIKDILAVLLKFNDIMCPVCSEYIAAYLPYWDIIEDLGVKPVEIVPGWGHGWGRDLSRDEKFWHGIPTYRIYRVQDIKPLIEDRLAKTEFLGVATITEDERGRPKLMVINYDYIDEKDELFYE